MKDIKTNNIVSMVLNSLIFGLTFGSILTYFLPGPHKAGNMDVSGTGNFIFFTNDSNILAAIASILTVPFNIKGIVSGKNEIPHWARVLKFVGTTAVTLTLTVVLLFLGIIYGYPKMFEGVCLPLHLLCPLMAIISFCFFEGGEEISKKELPLAVVPTLVYGVVYLACVIVFKVWQDFYAFNVGGFWYISFAVLTGVTCLLAFLLSLVASRNFLRQQ
ncbi:MAG: hypothetical protein IJL87_09250 [Clostridia bacterium]|nr:hypothetical protein [Clostridia bacterium]